LTESDEFFFPVRENYIVTVMQGVTNSTPPKFE